MDFALVGFLIGIAFGAILQRGRFCMASAARDLFLTKDTYLAKGVLYAILFTSIGFFLAQSQGLLELQIKPLGLQNVIGGLMFGVGMVVAGGCASGVLYRAGEGYITAFTAIFGVLFGMALYAELYEYLIAGFVESTTIGKLTLNEVLDVSPLTLIAVMVIVAVVAKVSAKKHD